MAASFYYWNDCVDFQDMEAMWREPEVSTEWLDAGETKGSKVHLSRDPDGEPYLTQTEMKAVADIIVRRHFDSQMHPDMICAIAELESDRQPLSTKWYGKKTKETALGIMQILPKTAEWLVRDLGYRAYEVEGNPENLYRPFVSVYFGAAYLKWLSNFEEKVRMSKKVSRPDGSSVPSANIACSSTAPAVPATQNTGVDYIYWDSKASPEDMQEMWSHSEVAKEWTKSGEKRGKVRFSHDGNKRPYLSRVEIKAVADIIRSKHFSTRGVKPSVLCALAEMVSMRFVNGAGPRTGLMGIDYSTAFWLYMELEYEGRERTPQFVVPAYLSGPKNVNHQETGPLWLKFEQALSCYEDIKRDPGNCTILSKHQGEERIAELSGNQCEAGDYMDDCGSTARVDYFEQPKVVNKTLRVLFVTFVAMVTASDPNIITDFVVPANSSTTIDEDFFTFTDLRGFVDGT
ncbi:TRANSGLYCOSYLASE [Salix koriyanagi]|uniref:TRANSGLYCOSYLASE n=1 Tax=Salix koriyanagi TaxID=2511006 RepID=A0A9Q1AEP4_9ROSI|nr:TRANSGLYCOSYLASE [Salix koriyanagi]